MPQKRSIIEFLNCDLFLLIEIFKGITKEFKSATKYEIRSHSKNYQITFEQGKYNWSYLYLEPEKLNPNLQLAVQLMALKWTEGMTKEEILAVDPIEFVREKLFDGESLESLTKSSPEEDFQEFQDAVNGNNEELKFLAEFMMAKFFDYLAYADHKWTCLNYFMVFLRTANPHV